MEEPLFSSGIMWAAAKGEYPAVLTGTSALPTRTVRLRVAVIKAEMRRHDLARTKNAQAVRTCGVVGLR